jgi:hypothetical protein
MISLVVGCIARRCTPLLACRKFVNFSILYSKSEYMGSEFSAATRAAGMLTGRPRPACKFSSHSPASLAPPPELAQGQAAAGQPALHEHQGTSPGVLAECLTERAGFASCGALRQQLREEQAEQDTLGSELESFVSVQELLGVA